MLSLFCLFVLCGPGSAQDLPAAENVTARKAPFHGFRPRARVDGDGTVHLVQMNREKRGDLFYTKLAAGKGEWSPPLQVNRIPGAVAAFTFVVGKDGRVHVMFRPTPAWLKVKLKKRKPVFADLRFMLHVRLNDEGDAFEEPFDISGDSFGLEGVGTLLADGEGAIGAFWHGQVPGGRGEQTRKIFRAVSTDGGKRWSSPMEVEVDLVGACACCTLNGHMDDDGVIRLAFRDSRLEFNTLHKDAWLLTSTDRGKSFETSLLGRWPDAGCPGAVFSLGDGGEGPFVAWRTKTKIYFSRADREIVRFSPIAGKNPSRAPFIAGGTGDTTLLLWGITGGKLKRGASHIVWQLYDRAGKAASRKGIIVNGGAEGWGSATAYPTPDGGFVMLYDGPGPDR